MSQATQSHLPEPNVDAYLRGEAMVIYEQCVAIAEEDPANLRSFFEKAAREVGAKFCTHEGPPRILEGHTAELRKASKDRGHGGLCGVHQAAIIAALEPQRVFAKNGNYKTIKFRNQACFEASIALNFRGHGVQAERGACFREACRALFPGDQEIHESIREALG